MGIEEFLLGRAEKKGFEIGFKEGCEEAKKELALKMKKYGLDVSLIDSIMNLSVNEIEQLS